MSPTLQIGPLPFLIRETTASSLLKSPSFSPSLLLNCAPKGSEPGGGNLACL
jgi:hypothetical protein